LQSLQGSEIVELNLVEGKIRRKDNPSVWAIPADQPFTGTFLSILFCFSVLLQSRNTITVFSGGYVDLLSPKNQPQKSTSTYTPAKNQ